MTTPPDLTVRPATPDDLPAVAGILSLVWPDDPVTVQTLTFEDDIQRAATLPLRHGRLLALRDGHPLGFAGYTQHSGMYHPQHFHVTVNVVPDARGQGTGRALAAALHAELAPHHPTALLAITREDHRRGLDFLARQGFREGAHYFESRLAVPTFDPAPFADRAALPAGYTLHSLADLGLTDDVLRAVYDLWSEVRQDVPRPKPATPMPYEQFTSRFQDRHSLLPEGFLLARHEESGTFAGLSELWRSDGPHLYTGLTGVRRAHRRHGLALSLKLAALRVAAALNAPEIRTENASSNAVMLALNDALGFRREVAWIEHHRGGRSV